MIRPLLLWCLLLSFCEPVFSQCVDTINITSYNSWTNADRYLNNYPGYIFAPDGDTSSKWNRDGNPIDIKLAPARIISLKNILDKQIKAYSGGKFFSRIEFVEVQMVYKDSLTDRKAVYVYRYHFKVDSLAFVTFGIAVTDGGRIITRFEFPSAKEYKGIDPLFSYCKLIAIAKKLKPDLEPIEEVSFNYDKLTKRFNWMVLAKIKNEQLGPNEVYFVTVDAADMSRHKLNRSMTVIDQ